MSNQMSNPKILVTGSSKDYELLDSGEGEKLERYGPVLMERPDPQALWPKKLSAQEWEKAGAYFSRGSDRAEWSFRKKLESKWPVEFSGLKFWIKPTAFKHTGLFPEQSPNWDWMQDLIKKSLSQKKNRDESAGEAGDVEVLNLFAYTGGATLACAQAGANVVHIDGSKAATSWARENAELSGLGDRPIRWIVEDARTFVEREIKRGRQYDGIILDPPAFGHGPENEVWKIEENLLDLIENCKKLLKPDPLFFLINGYAAGYSAIAYENNLNSLKEKFAGHIESGELAIRESKEGRLLPCGIYARWS